MRRLRARVDVKADRKAGVLRLKASHLEPGNDAGHVARELADAAREMADWLGLGDVVVEPRGDLSKTLASSIK